MPHTDHMRGFILSASLLLAGSLATGCLVSDARVGYSAGYSSPSLVYVSPGVQVVEDVDYPVFYSDSLYWRQDGGIWYSSRYHDRGWGRSYSVPVGVRGIERPGEYSHYRSANNAARYNNNRGGSGPVVRDHRSAPAPVVRSAPARSAPTRTVRDHRR